MSDDFSGSILDELPVWLTIGYRLEQHLATENVYDLKLWERPDRSWSLVPQSAIADPSLSKNALRVLAFRCLEPACGQNRLAAFLNVRQPEISKAQKKLAPYLQPQQACQSSYTLPNGERRFAHRTYRVVDDEPRVVMPLRPLQDRTITTREIRLLGHMGRYADEFGFTFIRPNQMKLKLGLQQHEVVDLIVRIVECGWIRIVELPSAEPERVTYEQDDLEKYERGIYHDTWDLEKLGLIVNYQRIREPVRRGSSWRRCGPP